MNRRRKKASPLNDQVNFWIERKSETSNILSISVTEIKKNGVIVITPSDLFPEFTSITLAYAFCMGPADMAYPNHDVYLGSTDQKIMSKIIRLLNKGDVSK